MSLELEPQDVTLSATEYPSCVLTRAQAQKATLERVASDPDCVDLNDTLFSSLFAGDRMSTPVTESPASKAVMKAPLSCSNKSSITREYLIAAQKADTSLKKYFTCVESLSLPRSGLAEF